MPRGAGVCYNDSIVLLANLPWLLFPIYIIYRMWRYSTPFTEASTAREAPAAQTFTEPGTLGVER